MSAKRESRERVPPKRDMNSPRLIAIVQRHPILWNMNLDEYKDPAQRSAEWERVASHFYNTTPEECLKKWNYIRTARTNNKRKTAAKERSGAAAKVSKPYKWSRVTSFLENMPEEEDEIQDGNMSSEMSDSDASVYSLSSNKENIRPKQDCKKRIYFTPGQKSSQKKIKVKSLKWESTLSPIQEISSARQGKEVPQNVTLHSISMRQGEKPVKKEESSSEIEDDPGNPPKYATKSKGRGILETDSEAEEEGVLPPKLSKKMMYQKAMHERREAQCNKIAKRVKAAQQGGKKQSTGTTDVTTALLNACCSEEDRFVYFCMSMVEPLRCLPPKRSRKLCLHFMTKIAEAEDECENECENECGSRGDHCQHIVPKLTEEEEDALSCVLNGQGEGIIVQNGGIALRLQDLRTLAWSPPEWLNDNVINVYMHLINKRSETSSFKAKALNTFLYQRLVRRGIEAAKEWITENLLEYDIIVIPIHLGGHWCLATISPKRNCIEYYDSMYREAEGSKNSILVISKRQANQCMELLLQLMAAAHNRSDIELWRKVHVKDSPQQLNGDDCGMFAIVSGERFAAGGKDLLFCQTDMTALRKKILHEILKGELLPWPAH